MITAFTCLPSYKHSSFTLWAYLCWRHTYCQWPIIELAMNVSPQNKTVASHTCHMVQPLRRGGSASIRILYTYVTSSGDIRYDNRSYAVVVQRKSCARRQISAPSVPSCVYANDLSFKVCVFRVVKTPHSCRERCYCSCWYVRTL